LGYLPAASPNAPIRRLHVSFPLNDYEWKDLVTDPQGEKALLLFNRIEPQEGVEDVKAVELSLANLSSRRDMNLGSGGQAVASFLRGSQAFYSFFVEKDLLGQTPGELPEFQVLQLPTTSFASA